MRFETALRAVLDELDLDIPEGQFAKLCGHFRLLERWNRRINLTAVRDPAEAARRHYGESAFLHRELPEAASLVDVGSGAGFPGLPVAVLRPEAEVTLLEATGKKAAFLREASRDLPNVTVQASRLADWTGTADWALLRAVAPASVLPDLAGRVEGVALLGANRPPDGGFGGWTAHRLPWGYRLRLWLGRAERIDVSRETSI